MNFFSLKNIAQIYTKNIYTKIEEGVTFKTGLPRCRCLLLYPVNASSLNIC